MIVVSRQFDLGCWPFSNRWFDFPLHAPIIRMLEQSVCVWSVIRAGYLRRTKDWWHEIWEKSRRMEIFGEITHSVTLTLSPSWTDCVHATLMRQRCDQSNDPIGHQNSARVSGGKKRRLPEPARWHLWFSSTHHSEQDERKGSVKSQVESS
jgi:hypothetical protein